MNTRLTFVLLSVSLSTAAQIDFRLFGQDNCNDALVKIVHFGIEKDGVVFSPNDPSGTLVLSDTGMYVLSYAMAMIDSSQLGRSYHIGKAGNFQDTLRLQSIKACLEPTTNPSFSGYCCCDQKCEGEQVDYYWNGEKRVQGRFKGGRPIGKLILYRSDGTVEEVHKYNKRGRLVRIVKKN